MGKDGHGVTKLNIKDFRTPMTQTCFNCTKHALGTIYASHISDYHLISREFDTFSSLLIRRAEKNVDNIAGIFQIKGISGYFIT